MSAKSNNSVLAIFCGQFGLSLMHTMFMFYYVKVFLNIFRVNEYWFNIAQFFFLIWNAVNDPFFGYLQDVSGTWMRDRSKIFTYFGPALVLSFIFTWFPWNSVNSASYVEGLHLIASLFLYDAFFSCIGVAWCALFTETTRDHRKRVRALKYTQLASLCSVNIITITEKVSHSLENFAVFQGVCVVVGLISLACLWVTGRLGDTSASKPSEKLLEDEESIKDKDSCSNSTAPSWSETFTLTKELLSAKDFQCVVFTNFVHICRSVAHMNFASIATDILIPQHILPKGSWQLSIFFAVCTLLPQIIVITNDRLLLRNGAYRAMVFSLVISMCSSSILLFSNSPYAIILFMLVDSITVHAASPLFNILLAEVVEDDTARNARKGTMSSLIFSLNALITKPAISIAPVVIVYFLNRNGYEFYRTKEVRSDELQLCMKRILFFIPLFLGGLEYLIFRRYPHRHMHRIPALPI